MFEPLTKLLDKHAVSLTDILTNVLSHLATIAENTQARAESVQFGDFSASANTGASKNTEIFLETREGYFWRVNQTAITGGVEGNCAVYIGAINPENLIDVISPTDKNVSTASYFVPRNSKLIFHFYEQPENQACTAHVQVDKLHESPEYTDRPGYSYDISSVDKHLQEPERHRAPRTEKPHPDELLNPIH